VGRIDSRQDKLMIWILLTFVVSASAVTLGIRAGTDARTMWLTVAGGYALTGALAVYRLGATKTLLDRLVPKWGDISLGIVTAAALLGLAWAGRELLLPLGSERLGWLGQLYGKLGSPSAVRGSLSMTGLVVLVSALEEISWRGLVQHELSVRVGQGRAWWLTAVSYAIATLPAAFLLADPVAGPNPVLPAGALSCGLAWGYVTKATGRLPPVMISHAVFTYFVVTRFSWPGL
jgi:membrane protease YdiL (CAAX protease family)